MRILPIKIILALAALFLSASASFANCYLDPEKCTNKELCSHAVTLDSYTGKRIWVNSREGGLAWIPFATEAHKRGLRCGLKVTAATKKLAKKIPYISSVDSKFNGSSNIDLCHNKWTGYLQEAKSRGLTCKSPNYSNRTAINHSFRNESLKRRRQIQHALKRLNYYTSSVDAQYGPGTERAIIAYAKSKRLSTNNPSAIFSKLLGQGSASSSTSSTKALSSSDAKSPNYSNRTAINYSFRNESLLKRKQIQYALKRLNYYNSSIDAQYGPGTERAIIAYAKSKRLSTNTPSAIFSSVLSQVSVPSSFAVAKSSNNSTSSSSSSSSGGSSAGKTLLQGLFVAGACSLTSNPGACLDGATGNNRSSNTRSSPPKTLSSGTWIKSGNTYIGPGGEAVFDNGRVIQGTDGSLCHRTRNAIICQ